MFKGKSLQEYRNLEATQNSSQEASYLSMWFCKATKQHALPQRLNSTEPLLSYRQLIFENCCGCEESISRVLDDVFSMHIHPIQLITK